MRQSFLLLDFEDASADSLKCMLMSCTLQPLYLTSEEVCVCGKDTMCLLCICVEEYVYGACLENKDICGCTHCIAFPAFVYM